MAAVCRLLCFLVCCCVVSSVTDPRDGKLSLPKRLHTYMVACICYARSLLQGVWYFSNRDRKSRSRAYFQMGFQYENTFLIASQTETVWESSVVITVDFCCFSNLISHSGLLSTGHDTLLHHVYFVLTCRCGYFVIVFGLWYIEWFFIFACNIEFTIVFIRVPRLLFWVFFFLFRTSFVRYLPFKIWSLLCLISGIRASSLTVRGLSCHLVAFVWVIS